MIDVALIRHLVADWPAKSASLPARSRSVGPPPRRRPRRQHV